MSRENGQQRRERQQQQRQQRNEETNETITIGATSFGKVNTSDSSAFRYPKHQSITSSSDYVTFEFFKYKPPFSDQGGGGNRRSEYNASADFSGEDILGEPGSTIIMYMPEDIQSEYGANWGGAGFGLIAKELMRGATGDFDLGRTIEGAFSAGKRKLVDFAVENANKALGTSVTTNQALAGTVGKVVNPNVEMMYEAPEMRGFSLNFKMFASSEDEANEIRKICNSFKQNMLPKFANQFIDVPNVVRVTFMTGPSPNQFISQFKPCAITNVSVNYTPDGTWATYRDGRPVATQLTIQFKELKMLFADDITLEGASY